jgi:single-strand DNA-binding protein
MNVNQVLLGGRLTHDPDISLTRTNKKKALFSIAVNTGFGEAKKTDYIDCEAWEKQADNLERATKGTTVVVVGRIEKQSWEDRETGKKRSKQIVKANQVDVMAVEGHDGQTSHPDRSYRATAEIGF